MPLDIRCREIARSSLLLAHVSDEIADRFLSEARIRDYPRGAQIFLQGEAAQSVFIAIDGWVKLYRTTRSGAEAVVGVLTRGSSFAETMALQSVRYPVAAEAVTDCRLLHISARAMQRWLKEEPELMLAVLASSYAHMRTLITQIEGLKAKTGAQRLAAFLLELCPCETGACTVKLPYEKVLIAGRLGIQPESLSRAFARLKCAGVSVRHSNAAIADVAALRRFAEEDRAEAWVKSN